MISFSSHRETPINRAFAKAQAVLAMPCTLKCMMRWMASTAITSNKGRSRMDRVAKAHAMLPGLQVSTSFFHLIWKDLIDLSTKYVQHIEISENFWNTDFYVRLCASITQSSLATLGMCFKPRHQSLGDHNSASSDRLSLRLPSSTPHLRSTVSPKFTPNFPGFVHQIGQSAWGTVCKYLPEFRAVLDMSRSNWSKERTIYYPVIPLSHFWIATKLLHILQTVANCHSDSLEFPVSSDKEVGLHVLYLSKSPGHVGQVLRLQLWQLLGRLWCQNIQKSSITWSVAGYRNVLRVY